jgi:hypothetical protein
MLLHLNLPKVPELPGPGEHLVIASSRYGWITYKPEHWPRWRQFSPSFEDDVVAFVRIEVRDAKDLVTRLCRR